MFIKFVSASFGASEVDWCYKISWILTVVFFRPHALLIKVYGGNSIQFWSNLARKLCFIVVQSGKGIKHRSIMSVVFFWPYALLDSSLWGEFSFKGIPFWSKLAREFCTEASCQSFNGLILIWHSSCSCLQEALLHVEYGLSLKQKVDQGGSYHIFSWLLVFINGH